MISVKTLGHANAMLFKCLVMRVVVSFLLCQNDFITLYKQYSVFIVQKGEAQEEHNAPAIQTANKVVFPCYFHTFVLTNN